MKNKKCPDCDGNLIIRNGKYGEFYGCSNFPRCKYTRDTDKTIVEKQWRLENAYINLCDRGYNGYAIVNGDYEHFMMNYEDYEDDFRLD